MFRPPDPFRSAPLDTVDSMAARTPPRGTDVWHIKLDVDPEAVRLAGLLLDDRERHRAGVIREERSAHRYVLAHGAIRTVLGAYLGVGGHAVRWSTGPNGKPAFDGALCRWHWNLSRSGGHAVLAVCLSAPVGVDIEQIAANTPAVGLANRYLPAEEAAAVVGATGPDGARSLYHRLLSRKEACVKASGGRLLDGLRLPVLRPGTVEGIGRFAGERWALRDLPAPPGFVAALASVGGGGEVRFFDWTGWGSARTNGNCRCSARPTAEPPDTGHLAWSDRRSAATS